MNRGPVPMMFKPIEVFVTIGTANLATLVAFYQTVLAQPPVTAIPGVYAEFRLPALKLGIFVAKSPPPLRSPVSPSMGLALCVEVEDLAAAIAHLTDLGYPPPGEMIRASHGQEIYAYDPEGNGLILHQSHVGPASSSASS